MPAPRSILSQNRVVHDAMSYTERASCAISMRRDEYFVEKLCT